MPLNFTFSLNVSDKNLVIIYPSTDFSDSGGRTRLGGLTTCEQLTSGNIYISQIPENKGYKNRSLPAALLWTSNLIFFYMLQRSGVKINIYSAKVGCIGDSCGVFLVSHKIRGTWRSTFVVLCAMVSAGYARKRTFRGSASGIYKLVFGIILWSTMPVSHTRHNTNYL